MMKTLGKDIWTSALSLLLVSIAFSDPARAGNDTLRLGAGAGTSPAASRQWERVATHSARNYLQSALRRPVPEVRLYLPPVNQELEIYRRLPPGPAGTPVQDFVFTRFSLFKKRL